MCALNKKNIAIRSNSGLVHMGHFKPCPVQGHVYWPEVEQVLFVSPCCQLGHKGCTDTATTPSVTSVWVHGPESSQGAFGVRHPHGCHIGSSACVCAAFVSQLIAIGLPARGCTQHLRTAVQVYTGLAWGTDAYALCEQGLKNKT